MKTLVGLHDGTVTAHSDGPGRGSHFIVTLPVVVPATGAATAVGATATGGAATNENDDDGLPLITGRPALPSLPALKIVIVEDNTDVRESLQDLLVEFGHHVEVAPEGEAGVALILRTEPDFAFIDLRIPALDGFGVARHVRAATMKKPVHLVAMTGFGQEPDRRRAHDAGFDAYLVKPVSVEAIFAVLSRAER